MTDEAADAAIQEAIRQAIGGDGDAIAWIATHAPSTDDAVLITMAALLEHDAVGLDRARSIAGTRCDRQVVEIARAHMAGDGELVDALARDHLVDYPGSFIVAWIAADAADRTRRRSAG